uniref:Putative secreted protein n=1 Tax=Anopheles darlingi TaxID=43151 RepID=A0A2M4D8M6_ANODA
MAVCVCVCVCVCVLANYKSRLVSIFLRSDFICFIGVSGVIATHSRSCPLRTPIRPKYQSIQSGAGSDAVVP